MIVLASNAYPVANTPGKAHYVGRIPVRNIWLLMLYASNLYRSLGAARVSLEENPDDIPDLVGEVLALQVERRLKRNLSYGYQNRKDVLGRVRGRIDMLYTERRQLLQRGKIACRFDELTINTPRNCYVRAALELLSAIVSRKNLAKRCKALAGSLRLMGVVGECPSRKDLSTERFGRHDHEDQQMVFAAHLAFDLALPTEDPGAKHLLEPDREIRWLRNLFERGVAGFYEAVLCGQGWRVKAGKFLHWQMEHKSRQIDSIFPIMKTDIILEHADSERRIIIDTKFNSLITQGRFRDETLRSGYIYQIYAYLRSQTGAGDPMADTATGMLLHPSVGADMEESVTIQGHEIRFATVDLGADAKTIRTQLLKRIEPSAVLPKHDM